MMQLSRRRMPSTTFATAMVAVVVAGCGSFAEARDRVVGAPGGPAAGRVAESSGAGVPAWITLPAGRNAPTPAALGGPAPGSLAPLHRTVHHTAAAPTDYSTVAVGGTLPRVVSQAEAISFDLLNAERAKVDRAPVRRVGDLTTFARNWALSMCRNGFKHSGGGAKALLTGSRTKVSENIVWVGDPSLTARQAAEKFQKLWRNSPGHYRNQTAAAHTEVGVGIHRDASGWWGVHEFANG